ncbi:hypothetical protein CVV43_04160 [Candidatus Saccharibacteria bacterium HGW-Saccharibacteria-1]|jgi:hypothetical protein|nr:MAG: hypothetical protein CVV43_04160 [Candidatus Saccharibacteria bacterium HGW-Saccharibacteria-1]
MYKLGYIDKLEASFQERLSQIFNLSHLPLNIINITSDSLGSISKSLEEISGFNSSKIKIRNQVSSIRSIGKNKDIQRQFEVFNSQIVVLMVGALEAQFYDVVKAIGDHNPELFNFESNGSKPKVITFEATLLDERTSVGEIMRHYFKERDGDVNFQDIQSIVRFFSERLLCDLEIDDYRDVLIFATAARNVTVHNNQIIDQRFLNQIRDTAYVDLEVEDENGLKSKKYTTGRMLNISSNDIGEIKEALLSLVSEVGVKIKGDYES